VQNQSPSLGGRVGETATDLCLSGSNSELYLITLLNTFWRPSVEVRCSASLLYSPQLTLSSLGNWLLLLSLAFIFLLSSKRIMDSGSLHWPKIVSWHIFPIHYSSCHKTPHKISPRCWQCHKINHKQTKYWVVSSAALWIFGASLFHIFVLMLDPWRWDG